MNHHHRTRRTRRPLRSLLEACLLAGIAISCATVTSFPSESDPALLASGGTSTGGNTDDDEESTASGGVVDSGGSMGGEPGHGGPEASDAEDSANSTGGSYGLGDKCVHDDDCDGEGCQQCLLDESTFLFTCQEALDVSDCGGACADLASDTLHCGACDNKCPVGATCTDGDCSCSPGESECNAECVDTTGDPDNCGSCGNSCTTATPYCRSGSCRECLNDNESNCGNGCQNLQNDDNNCGSCGNVCSGDEECDGGVCQGGVCDSAPLWSSSVTYQQGSQVQHGGSLWRANYVTIGQIPTNTVVGSEPCTNYWCLISSC